MIIKTPEEIDAIVAQWKERLVPEETRTQVMQEFVAWTFENPDIFEQVFAKVCPAGTK